jgi:zinc protease
MNEKVLQDGCASGSPHVVRPPTREVLAVAQALDDAIAIMFREIERMQKGGATKGELADAQNYYAGSYPIRFSSNQGKLYEAMNIELYQLGMDWVDKYPGRIRALTLDDINRAARDRLHPGQYVMVVMGNAVKEDLGLTDVEWIE